MKDDTISRAAALDALGERPVVWSDNDDYTLGERNQYDMDRLAIETVPSAQPEITLESAIDYLHSIGWMQNHDRILTESAQPSVSKAEIVASDCISRRAMINEIDLHVGILYDSPTLVQSLKLLVQSLPSAQQIPWDKNTQNSMVFTLRKVLNGGDMDAVDRDNIKRLSRWLEGGEQ